ncbi:MAG: hypothetical protein NTY19_50655 [Planctomycetota bacterium]|nr:hypothetical protein [Planctomycetota bacterium]
MVTLTTSDGSFCLPDEMVRAIIRNSEFQADLAAAVIDAMGIFKTKPIRLPAGFLLEFAAVVQLGFWERQGVRQRLNADLLTYSDAAKSLAARAAKGPAEFADLEATPISHLVTRAFIENFAWEGPDHLGADVIIGQVDEEQFADVLAEFVWQHRRELSTMLNVQE